MSILHAWIGGRFHLSGALLGLAFFTLLPVLTAACTVAATSVDERAVVQPALPAPTTAVLPAPSGDPAAAELDGWMREIVAPAGFKGAVLVARGDNILLSKGYGLFDVQRDIPDTPSTRFNINYLTMPFTAMAVLQLQERGLLNVDDPFCRYRDQCPPAWRSVTIHHLLSCSSGIPEYFGIPDLLARRGTPISQDYLLDWVSELDLDFPPGSRWGWCSTNYLILSQIIERLSGQSHHDFVRDNILDPLAMADSGFGEVPGMPVQYKSPMSATQADPIFVENYYGVGDMYSTTEDLFRWARALRSEALVSRPTLDRMFKRQLYGNWSQAEEQATSYIGYPWFVDWSSFPQPNAISMGGFQYGFTTVLALFPEADLTVIVLSNQENIVEPDARDLARDLALMALEGQ